MLEPKSCLSPWVVSRAEKFISLAHCAVRSTRAWGRNARRLAERMVWVNGEGAHDVVCSIRASCGRIESAYVLLKLDNLELDKALETE